VSRIFDALSRAESNRRDVPQAKDVPHEIGRELADDVSSLAAAVKRIERRLEQQLPEVRQEMAEELAGIEVSIGAIEDRLDLELGPADPETQQGGAARARSLQQRLAHLEHELPILRPEMGETIEKRVQSAVSQLIERERTTRDRFEVRLDALRRDLDRGQQRHTILLGAILLCGLLVYAC